jgi:hypothetical protein
MSAQVAYPHLLLDTYSYLFDFASGATLVHFL